MTQARKEETCHLDCIRIAELCICGDCKYYCRNTFILFKVVCIIYYITVSKVVAMHGILSHCEVRAERNLLSIKIYLSIVIIPKSSLLHCNPTNLWCFTLHHFHWLFYCCFTKNVFQIPHPYRSEISHDHIRCG